MKTYLFLSIGLFSFLTHAATVEFSVKLSPAGSFKAKNDKATGFAKKVGDSYVAEDIRIPMDSFKTGIELRDKHMREKLEADKFKESIVLSAKGQGGKGTAEVKIRNIEKKISGTFEIKDESLVANFKLNIKDFGITGVRYLNVGVKDEIDVTFKVPVKK